jgi:hypothetical protein
MEENPRESMRLCVAILKIGGLWHTRDMSRRDAILYNVLKTFVVTVFCVITSQVYVYLFVIWGRFEDMLETIAYCITMTVFTLKLHVMLSRKDEVQHIIKTAQENFIIHGTELSTENRKIIKNTIKRARNIAIAYATMQTSSLALYIIFGPLISSGIPHDTQNTTDISSGTHTPHRKLPFEIWFPVDVTKSPRFEIAYIYLSITGIVNSWTVVGMEVFCMTTFIYITGQFELLCDSIRNASQRVKDKIDERRHSSAGCDDISKLQVFPSNMEKIKFSNATTESSFNPAVGKVNIMRHLRFPRR